MNGAIVGCSNSELVYLMGLQILGNIYKKISASYVIIGSMLKGEASPSIYADCVNGGWF